jgi:hypothetical protein
MKDLCGGRAVYIGYAKSLGDARMEFMPSCIFELH